MSLDRAASGSAESSSFWRRVFAVIAGMGVLGLGLCAFGAQPALAAPPQEGVSFGTFFRVLGICAAAVSVIALILVQFVFYDRFRRTTRHWILMVLLLVFPLLSVLATMETVMEETKTVNSCQSCHVMEPFVGDMKDSSSTTLASQHFSNKWIPKQQCYQCHTTYGVHGTLAGKRDGFRHWLLYVTGTYDMPIQYSGSYPNANCTSCHAGDPDFESVDVHSAIRTRLATDKVSCTSCHGPPHPTPDEREVHASVEAPAAGITSISDSTASVQ